jgi:hypothetical protein
VVHDVHQAIAIAFHRGILFFALQGEYLGGALIAQDDMFFQ